MTLLTKEKLTFESIASELFNYSGACDLFVNGIKEWINEEEIIWFADRIAKCDHVTIITKNKSGYSLFRCFPLSHDKIWEVSVDIFEGSEQLIFDRLLYLLSQ